MGWPLYYHSPRTRPASLPRVGARLRRVRLPRGRGSTACCPSLPWVGTAPRAVLLSLVGLALRANLAAPVGVWLQRVHAMVPDPFQTGASSSPTSHASQIRNPYSVLRNQLIPRPYLPPSQPYSCHLVPSRPSAALTFPLLHRPPADLHLCTCLSIHSAPSTRALTTITSISTITGKL